MMAKTSNMGDSLHRREPLLRALFHDGAMEREVFTMVFELQVGNGSEIGSLMEQKAGSG
jgi:hypothetical protein